jgi:hypothetical protein
MNNKFKFLYKYAPWILTIIGISLPIVILCYTEYKIRKLDTGIENDFERIKQKGKKFSDIPQSPN